MDESAPEEVKADSLEILKLKELHEQVIEPLTKRRKRKQREERNRARIYNLDTNKVESSGTTNVNEDLDPSILNCLDGEEDDEGREGKETEDEDKPTDVPAINIHKIDSKTRRGKKM